MDLFEYQGRDLFERHGLPVLGGGVAETPQEARAIAERLGGKVVVKAQVKVGGRGKAGGVKVAKSADEAYEHALAGDVAPRSVSSPQQCTSEPPVASIGSRTKTSRSTSDFGSEAMYASGWKVTSLRARPTKPICDSGSIPCAVSAMPRPARSTGTISGGAASR